MGEDARTLSEDGAWAYACLPCLGSRPQLEASGAAEDGEEGSLPEDMDVADASSADTDEGDGSACFVCGSSEDEHLVLLCDGCPGEYHIGCLSPPLAVLPKEDTWLCPTCCSAKGGSSSATARGRKAVPIQARRAGTLGPWKTYESQGDAARKLGVNQGNVSVCIRGEREQACGYEFRRLPSSSSSPSSSYMVADSACFVCGSSEDEHLVLLCDGCPGEYHIGCLSPPLAALPEEDTWLCPTCCSATGASAPSGSSAAASSSHRGKGRTAVPIQARRAGTLGPWKTYESQSDAARKLGVDQRPQA